MTASAVRYYVTTASGSPIFSNTPEAMAKPPPLIGGANSSLRPTVMEKDIRKSFVMNWNSILDGSLSNPDNPPLILRQSLVFEKSYLNQPDKLPLAAYYRQYRQPIFEIFDCIFFVNETHQKTLKSQDFKVFCNFSRKLKRRLEAKAHKKAHTVGNKSRKSIDTL